MAPASGRVSARAVRVAAPRAVVVHPGLVGQHGVHVPARPIGRVAHPRATARPRVGVGRHAGGCVLIEPVSQAWNRGQSVLRSVGVGQDEELLSRAERVKVGRKHIGGQTEAGPRLIQHTDRPVKAGGSCGIAGRLRPADLRDIGHREIRSGIASGPAVGHGRRRRGRQRDRQRHQESSDAASHGIGIGPSHACAERERNA